MLNKSGLLLAAVYPTLAMSLIRHIAKRTSQGLFALLLAVLIWYGFHRVTAHSRAVKIVEISDIRSDASEDRTLRLGAFNIAHGRGGKLGESNWSSSNRAENEAQLEKIATQIAVHDLDLIVLNEVDFDAYWSGGIDQAEYIAKQAGFRYIAKQRNIDIDLPFFNLQFGNAILSKRPLQDLKLLELPPVKNWEPYLAGKKNALSASTRLQGQRVNVIAIHLETRSKETRHSSLHVVINHLQESEDPHLILGDFNSTRSTTNPTVVDILINKLGFHSDADPILWKTFPSQSPKYGIDWILSQEPLQTSRTQTIQSDLSDHLMIISDIQLAN